MHDALLTITEGLGFPEAPRWHDDHLWVTDIANREIVALTATGERTSVIPTPFQPSGLGWLPDGTLLIVDMHAQAVMRRTADGFAVHADIGHLITAPANDMVTAPDGTSYVTNLGYDAETEEPRTTQIVRVAPDGAADAQPGPLMRPNGVALTADGKTLYVAETRVHRVSAFDVAGDGTLSGLRIVAELPAGAWADGICLDRAGGLWIGDPMGKACYRVFPGEGITHRIDTAPGACVACVLGGPDRRTLYLTIGALGDLAERARERRGQIAALRVDEPGAGRP